jgi:hypothetical protein
MNGHPRDQVSIDLRAGRPTISTVADPLALRVAALMSEGEAEKLFNGIEYRAQRSARFEDWMTAPTTHLSEFDAETASAIEAHLIDLHRRMVRRAKRRGWEVEA